MSTDASTQRGMTSAGRNKTTTTTTTKLPVGVTTSSMPEAEPTLSERELMKIEFYKTYDVMTGVRIAATLSGFFSIMVLLVIYKSRRKSSRQLEDPELKAAAEAAVAEAEAEERALAAALEAIARLPPKPARGPRRSLCVDKAIEPRLPLFAPPRFASVAGDYDSLLGAVPRRSSRMGPHRRCSSATCSSTASSYLERRGSAMVMPCLPPPPSYPSRRAKAYDEPWDLYHHHPIDIQVIQPTPELSPCGSEAGLYAASALAVRPINQQQYEVQVAATRMMLARRPHYQGRAPLASMVSVDPPEQDSSRSLGTDSVFRELRLSSCARLEDDGPGPADTEDEVSGFSTDSSDGTPVVASSTPTGLKRFLKVPLKVTTATNSRRRPPERWDGCAGCVPRRRRRTTTAASSSSPTCQACMTISASVEALSSRSPTSTTTSSSQNSIGASCLGSPPPAPQAGPSKSSPIELKHRPASGGTSRPVRSSPPPTVWSQETLF